MLYQGNIRDYLSKQPLLFDGAMGTYLADKYIQFGGESCEKWNLRYPERINRYTKSILMPEQWRSKQTHLRPMQEIILRQKRLERL